MPSYYLTQQTRDQLEQLLGRREGMAGGGMFGTAGRQVGFVRVTSGTSNPYTCTAVFLDAAGAEVAYQTGCKVYEAMGRSLVIGNRYFSIRTGDQSDGTPTFLTDLQIPSCPDVCSDTWTDVTDLFLSSVGQTLYLTWVKKTRQLSCTGGTLCVQDVSESTTTRTITIPCCGSSSSSSSSSSGSSGSSGSSSSTACPGSCNYVWVNVGGTGVWSLNADTSTCRCTCTPPAGSGSFYGQTSSTTCGEPDSSDYGCNPFTHTCDKYIPGNAGYLVGHYGNDPTCRGRCSSSSSSSSSSSGSSGSSGSSASVSSASGVSVSSASGASISSASGSSGSCTTCGCHAGIGDTVTVTISSATCPAINTAYTCTWNGTVWNKNLTGNGYANASCSVNCGPCWSVTIGGNCDGITPFGLATGSNPVSVNCDPFHVTFTGQSIGGCCTASDVEVDITL